jgi:hypothetical protein
MAAWKGGFSGTPLSIADIRAQLKKITPPRWPKKIAIHNTYKPDLHLWKTTRGGSPQRIRNLEHEFRNLRHYSGGPHWFVSPDNTDKPIYEGTPITKTGVHSPGLNAIAIGIELAGDYTLGKDDDDAGEGLRVKDYGAQLTAALLEWLDLPADNNAIIFHFEDRRTTHRGCPGNDLEKPEFVARVKKHLAAFVKGAPKPAELEEAGDHGDLTQPPKPARSVWVNTPKDTLNLRSTSGMAGTIVAKLPDRTALVVTTEAKNATTLWLYVNVPATGQKGWVASKFVTDKAPAQPPAAAPTPAAPPQPTPTKPVSDAPKPPQPTPAKPADESTGLSGAIILVDQGKFEPVWAFGAMGNVMREAYADIRHTAKGDKMDVDPGPGVDMQFTAFGAGQWRGPRFAGLKALAATRGVTWEDWPTQMLYLIQELRTTEKLAWKWLQQATTTEQATAAMVLFERPRGYSPARAKAAKTWAEIIAVAKAGDGWSVRLDNAKSVEAQWKKLRG